MKIDIKNNEAFIKIAVKDSALQFSYSFNMDELDTEKLESGDPEAIAIMTAVTMLAGLVTCAKEYAEHMIDIGEGAIESGDFQLEYLSSQEMQNFMETLDADAMELLVTPTEGVQ